MGDKAIGPLHELDGMRIWTASWHMEWDGSKTNDLLRFTVCAMLQRMCPAAVPLHVAVLKKSKTVALQRNTAVMHNSTCSHTAEEHMQWHHRRAHAVVFQNNIWIGTAEQHTSWQCTRGLQKISFAGGEGHSSPFSQPDPPAPKGAPVTEPIS